MPAHSGPAQLSLLCVCVCVCVSFFVGCFLDPSFFAAHFSFFFWTSSVSSFVCISLASTPLGRRQDARFHGLEKVRLLGHNFGHASSWRCARKVYRGGRKFHWRSRLLIIHLFFLLLRFLLSLLWMPSLSHFVCISLASTLLGRRRADARACSAFVDLEVIKSVPDVFRKILVMPAVNTLPEWPAEGGLKCRQAAWPQVPQVSYDSSLDNGAPANCWPTEHAAWPGTWALSRLLGWGKGYQGPSSLVTA